MATTSLKTGDPAADDISPDDSASNVAGTTHTSTRYVMDTQRMAAAAEVERLLQEEHRLEMTVAEIQDENDLAEMEEENQRRRLKHEEEARQREVENRRQEMALESERAARARRRRLRQAEMSMKEFRARNEALQEQEAEKGSTVSRRSVARSATSVSYKDAREPQGVKAVVEDAREGSDETVREVIVAEKGKGVSKPTSSEVPPVTPAGVQRRRGGDAVNVPETAKTDRKFSSTQLPEKQWLNDCLMSFNMSPLVATARKPEKEIQHKRRATATFNPEIIMKENRATVTTTAATITTTTVSAPSATYLLRAYGDRQGDFWRDRDVGDASPLTSQMGYQPPTSRFETVQTGELASAIQKLASANELSQLPRTELITFDGSSKNYQRLCG